MPHPLTNDHLRPPSIRWTVENCQRLLDLEVRKGHLRAVRDRLLAAWNMMDPTLMTTKCALAKKLGTLRTEMLPSDWVRGVGEPTRPPIEGRDQGGGGRHEPWIAAIRTSSREETSGEGRIAEAHNGIGADVGGPDQRTSFPLHSISSLSSEDSLSDVEAN